MHNSLLWLNHRFKDEANRSSVQWTDNQELLENPENPSISWTNDAAMAATNDQNYFTYNAATTLPNSLDYIGGTKATAFTMYLSETNDDVIRGDLDLILVIVGNEFLPKGAETVAWRIFEDLSGYMLKRFQAFFRGRKVRLADVQLVNLDASQLCSFGKREKFPDRR